MDPLDPIGRDDFVDQALPFVILDCSVRYVKTNLRHLFIISQNGAYQVYDIVVLYDKRLVPVYIKIQPNRGTPLKSLPVNIIVRTRVTVIQFVQRFI